MVKKLDFVNLYILYTGGTIGMLEKGEDGLVPVKGNLKKLIDNIKITSKLNLKYKLDRIEPLIDSSNLRDNDWKLIITKLHQNYKKYDSFVLIHGTDTLVYTASALSFFLNNWKKSIIITGSQIPLVEFRNDARINLINSIELSFYRIPQVLIVFGGKILRGNRSKKVSSVKFIAYDSPNFKDLGNMEVDIKLCENIEKKTESNFTHYKRSITDILDNWNKNINIVSMTLLPRDNNQVLEALINLNPNAIILRTYGIGNAPISDTLFIQQLKRAQTKNIIIVNSSQCLEGGVNMNYYNTGLVLKKYGIIGLNDMTFEAIYAKLFYLFQIFGDIHLIKKNLKTNISGEITL